MRREWLWIFSTFLLMGSLFFSFRVDEHSLKNTSIAQNTYFGPDHPLPGNPHLVQIEILIRDGDQLGGVEIQSVEFAGQSIPLKPRDIFGNRGSASFQLAPGTYFLKWSVQQDKINWPRTVSHEEKVKVDPRDLWIQIAIVGNEASIN